MGYYYGSFVSEDLSSGAYLSETYSESMRKEKREAFLKLSDWLPEAATDWTVVQFAGWIVPDFSVRCAM